MTTYVYRNGELIEKESASPLHPLGPATYLIRDQMDELWHPATGEYIDSKSQFRRRTKDAGCVEVGDQRDYGKQRLFTPTLDKRQRREDVQHTIYNLRNGIRS